MIELKLQQGAQNSSYNPSIIDAANVLIPVEQLSEWRNFYVDESNAADKRCWRQFYVDEQIL